MWYQGNQGVPICWLLISDSGGYLLRVKRNGGMGGRFEQSCEIAVREDGRGR